VFPDKAVTVRPAETRIGSGKGNPEYWVSRVNKGTVIFELCGIPESIARKAIKIVGSKLPIKVIFVTRKNYVLLTGRTLQINMIQTQTRLKVADNSGADG
jgi:large subunit ribosomal protein L16